MKLCVSIVEPTIERVRSALEIAARANAMAEVRLDALDDGSGESIVSMCEGRPTPIILTWRRPEDGGRRHLDEESRLGLLVSASRVADYVDLEVDVAGRAPALGIDASRLLVSHHDVRTTPSNLAEIYTRMAAHPAAVYKIATYAEAPSDVVAHFALLARARRDGRQLVALAMGARGVASRILGPAYGAAFSFCSLECGKESAPGQLSIDDMRSLYRVDAIGEQTWVTGLVAASTGYSLSPMMHNRAFASLGIDAVYLPFEVDDVGPFLAECVRPRTRQVPWRVRGLSVTNPHKTSVIPFLDRLDPLAERVGAVNTIVVEGDELWGYNTDVEGAIRPLERVAGRLEGKAVGVLGAGGAARAVVYGLVKRGAHVSVFSRRPEAGEELAAALGATTALSVEALAGMQVDVLINATPVGTAGDSEDEMPIPAECLSNTGLVYDLVYNPRETRLLTEAHQRGCATLSGIEMLATQAALQFELWTGEAVAADELKQSLHLQG